MNLQNVVSDVAFVSACHLSRFSPSLPQFDGQLEVFGTSMSITFVIPVKYRYKDIFEATCFTSNPKVRDGIDGCRSVGHPLSGISHLGTP